MTPWYQKRRHKLIYFDYEIYTVAYKLSDKTNYNLDLLDYISTDGIGTGIVNFTLFFCQFNSNSTEIPIQLELICFIMIQLKFY